MTAVEDHLMRAALEHAYGAGAAGDVPVGALIVQGDRVLAQSGNRTMRDHDPTAHAELLVIRAAAEELGTWRLDGCALYVTLEPCAMCAGAIVLARLDALVFGAWDEKAGMAGSVGDIVRHPKLNHRPQVRGGVLADECGALLREFFASRRVDPRNGLG
jgi:tRNA(adenine34) deaminase